MKKWIHAATVVDYEQKQLKSYKGYEIWKVWDITDDGRRINIQYEVADDEDAIDFFSTLQEAKNYINNVLV